MNPPPSYITRRGFLRACAMTGAGLASFSPRLTKADPHPAYGKIIVGLEMGTSKICAAVGERFAEGTIGILGIGQSLSRGVTAHGIVDFEAASRGVREALADAEARSGVIIRSVVLAVTGAKIAPCDDGPTWDEIFEWEEICFADRGDGILRRVRLPECKGTQGWQVAWGAGPRILNSIRCLDDLGVEVERIVYAPVASAAAVLSAEQKQLGALVIDMGFGTTDYAVYSGGTLVQSDSFGIGGGHIANDLSLGLRIPLARAEKLLIEEGGLAPGLVLTVEIKPIVLGAEPGFVRREIEREVFTTIIRCRVEQTLNLVKWRLVNSGVRLDSLLAGVHITGGCALQARHLRIGREGFRHPRPARSGEIPRQLAFRMCNSQHPSCVRNWACEFQ